MLRLAVLVVVIVLIGENHGSMFVAAQGADTSSIGPSDVPSSIPSMSPTYADRCYICGSDQKVIVFPDEIVLIGAKNVTCGILEAGGLLSQIPPDGCKSAQNAGCTCKSVPTVSSDIPSITPSLTSITPSISPNSMDGTSKPSVADMTPPPIGSTPTVTVTTQAPVPPVSAPISTAYSLPAISSSIIIAMFGATISTYIASNLM